MTLVRVLSLSLLPKFAIDVALCTTFASATGGRGRGGAQIDTRLSQSSIMGRSGVCGMEARTGAGGLVRTFMIPLRASLGVRTTCAPDPREGEKSASATPASDECVR